MSEAVKDMFATIAPRYDLANRLMSCGRDVAWRRRSLKLFDQAPGRLLDLACGTHDLGLDALAMGKADTVIGTDFCLPMLDAGRQKQQGHPLQAVNGDALHLPFADGAFDAAMMAYGWRNLDDAGAGLDELQRILRPGGQLLLLEFFRPTNLFAKLFYGTFGRYLFPIFGKIVSGDAAAYRYLHDSIKGFVSVAEAQDLLHAHGFAEVQTVSFFGGISHGLKAVKAKDSP